MTERIYFKFLANHPACDSAGLLQQLFLCLLIPGMNFVCCKSMYFPVAQTMPVAVTGFIEAREAWNRLGRRLGNAVSGLLFGVFARKYLVSGLQLSCKIVVRN